MIVPDDKATATAMDNSDTTAPPNDLPPPYVGPQHPHPSPGEAARASGRSFRPAPRIPASNFVIVKRVHDGITDSYVIDTQLRVPEGVLSTTPKDGEDSSDHDSDSGQTPNLHLESTHGSIHADIWLVQRRGRTEAGENMRSNTDDRALINVKTGHSVINTRLRCETQQPYILCCSSSHGSVNVWLPPNFVGPATISTSFGSVFFSPALRKRCTTFSEVNNVRTCFIGDFEAAGFQNISEWKGSVLQLSSSTSSIKVNSIEELSSESSILKEGSGFSWWNPFSW